MPENFEPESERGHEAEWEKLNIEHGGRLEERVRLIRLDPCRMTRIEAKVSALAEIGYNPMETAIALGRDEQTIKNHRVDIRHKKKAPRKGMPFDMLFLLPPHPQEKNEK